MSRGRVIVTVGIEFYGQQPARDMLETAGLECIHSPGSPGWPDDETRDNIRDKFGILAGAELLDASTMADARDLRVIARNGVGFDRVDLDYCTERGIVVTNTPGAMADAVADLTLALLLGTVRHLVTGNVNVMTGDEYDVPMGEDLASLTLGMIGCGHIGAETVRRARAFKMPVLVEDPWVDPQRIRDLGAEPVDRARLLAEADVISLHLPLTDDNVDMVDADFIAAMKPGSFFINTARGGIVDEAALISALRSGHIAGAGLDCQATEPPVGLSKELVDLGNVIALPHCASKTSTARKRMSIAATESIIDVVEGRTPEFVVNREVLEKLDLAPRE
ncbi:MAG: phosphoglycerate dehydrogenase [Gemmatimonadetes bacterium]|nr:phosphoglycerate dehydrogenase [Gemmatimonadota bacterium]MBT6145590.1 phosphoglycerate dehydrogenase [Gemmatimonadota bacterium]MBT7863509.1 phosphoglycerate dehydrogenase [Gemmatimonadota bacterium]